ncbi:MAG: hypothetical protein KBC95_01930 [Candidatus Peribacteraceae bacterium]|nr:hypothetical protein [Candidatus Peribacteraceae bacterium]
MTFSEVTHGPSLDSLCNALARGHGLDFLVDGKNCHIGINAVAIIEGTMRREVLIHGMLGSAYTAAEGEFVCRYHVETRQGRPFSA